MKFSFIIRIIVLSIIFSILDMIYDDLWYFVFFLTIHELVHCITGISLGYSINRLRFLPFGITANFNDEFIKPRDDILISISGPLINFVFFIIFTLSYSPGGELLITLREVNLLLFIFNIIPAGFLDGGRILKSIVKIHFSFYYGYLITNINGIILGVLIILEAVNIHDAFQSIILSALGVYFIYMSYKNQKDIIINIIKDAINKQNYMYRSSRVKIYQTLYPGSSKILNIIKNFCFSGYHIVYLIDEGKPGKSLTEKDVIDGYCREGNIALNELLNIYDT